MVIVEILYSVHMYRGICDQYVKLPRNSFFSAQSGYKLLVGVLCAVKHTPSSSSILMHSESEPKH